ncbi:SGNH/GDSL hydrolase family protein [Zobellia laminariae]|uniref:SGNH/GDSL hydrolase family protein n=1 Tax=Zobellia laminariae TaxID=248906 RepID=UPI003EF0B9D5
MTFFRANIVLILLVMLSMPMVFAQTINAGISGNTTVDLLERLETDVLNHEPDFVILMVGTNDMLNSKKLVSYASYEKNLGEIVKKIKQAGAQILMMSPPPVDSVYLYQRHDKTLFKNTPNEKLKFARNIVKKVANESESEYLDLNQVFSKMNLPEHNKDLFFRNERNSGVKDGVHPTALGYRFIAETVFDFLKTNNLIHSNQKIVCFGDSITYGSGVENGGTVVGGNYPAVLTSLINENFK